MSQFKKEIFPFSRGLFYSKTAKDSSHWLTSVSKVDERIESLPQLQKLNNEIFCLFSSKTKEMEVGRLVTGVPFKLDRPYYYRAFKRGYCWKYYDSLLLKEDISWESALEKGASLCQELLDYGESVDREWGVGLEICYGQNNLKAQPFFIFFEGQEKA